MQFRCLQVAKSIHPAYKCDLSFCRGPSISMTRPRNPHSPPFALSHTHRKGTARHLLPRETPFQRRFPARCALCHTSCECFVPIDTIRSTQLLKPPKEADRTPSYIVFYYTCTHTEYTACLHTLSPGACDSWFGIFGLTPPVDYSDRPHGIIFSAVADCSARAFLLCLFLSSPADSLSVYFLSISLLFSRNPSVSFPRHISSSQGHRRSSQIISRI